MASYTIEHVSPDGSTFTDISGYLTEMDSFRLYSDGRISTASLTLRAENGAFRTDPATPQINNFDRIRITATDSAGRSYRHIFEAINDLSQLTNTSEYLLPLTLEGRERALALVPFSFYADPPVSHYDMVEQILTSYTAALNAATQPLIVTDIGAGPINGLPRYALNIWDFLYVDNCLDAILSVVRLANESVPAGGTGDRWGIIYEDGPTLGTMGLRILPQGQANSGTIPILRGLPLTNPIQSIAKTKQPPTGSIVIARGRPGSGGVPVEGDKYRSRIEEYQRLLTRQTWESTIRYDPGSYSSIGGTLYRALRTSTNVRPGSSSSDWQPVGVTDYVGPIQYSPFTVDKATLFRNECVNPDSAFNGEIEASPHMLDSNIVIEDVETKRDWVHLRQTTDAVSSWSASERKYLFRGASFYEGFRLLIDGNAQGIFARNTYGTGTGRDPNGKPYSNNPVVYVGGKWYVIRETGDFDQILSRYDGLYEWNVAFALRSRTVASDRTNPDRRYRGGNSSGTRAWRALGDQFLANDCLHSPKSIANVDGLVAPNGSYADGSAVRIIYEYGHAAEIDEWRGALDKIVGFAASALGFLGSFALNATAATFSLFASKYWRNVGWWITLSSPFPFSTHNGISEQVGQLYGAGTSPLASTLSRHSTFDVYNKSYTFTGLPGWVEADSDTLMEITGVTFLFRLDLLVDGVTVPFTGDIACSYWAIDDNGTIWKTKSKYRHLKDVQRMTFEFGDFSPVYRARTPFGIDNIVTNILAPELEIRERLFPNRIRMQGFQLEGAYDDHGRYLPNVWESVIKPSIIDLFSTGTFTGTIQFVGDIDYFQWVKTPISIQRVTGGDRTIVPEIRDYPNISNIEQLRRAATAALDVEKFQFEQYEITRNDSADLSLQDSVYLHEGVMIAEAEAPRPSVSVPWVQGVKYYEGNAVLSGGAPYVALQTTRGDPPASSPASWEGLADPVRNTRLLTVGEIAVKVNKSREVQFTHALVRRIPRI